QKRNYPGRSEAPVKELRIESSYRAPDSKIRFYSLCPNCFLMSPQLFDKYEMKEVHRLLDGLQLLTDRQIYSKESPLEDRNLSVKDSTDLEKLFAPHQINKRTSRVILDHVHTNFLGF